MVKPEKNYNFYYYIKAQFHPICTFPIKANLKGDFRRWKLQKINVYQFFSGDIYDSTHTCTNTYRGNSAYNSSYAWGTIDCICSN